MTARSETKTITRKPAAEETVPENTSQRRRPEIGPFRLQVDRQTKESFPTLEAAEAAGMVIKTGFPNVQVSVYDTVNSTNKIIEASKG